MYFWIIIFQNKLFLKKKKKGYIQKKVFEEAESIMGGGWWWRNVVYLSKIVGKHVTGHCTLKKEPEDSELNEVVKQ